MQVSCQSNNRIIFLNSEKLKIIVELLFAIHYWMNKITALLTHPIESKPYIIRFPLKTAMCQCVSLPVTLGSCEETSNVAKTHHTSQAHRAWGDSMDEPRWERYHTATSK